MMVDLEYFQVACIQPKKATELCSVVLKNYIFACDFDPFIFFSFDTVVV